MSGKRVTDRQVRRYMDSRKDGHTQAAADQDLRCGTADGGDQSLIASLKPHAPFEPPCAPRLALPRRGLRRAQHDHLVRKTARDALEQTELCRTNHAFTLKTRTSDDGGATTPAPNEEADRLI